MSDSAPSPGTASTRPFTTTDYGLYAAVVFFWGTSWIALHLQLGHIAPAVSLTWRFILAALIMLVFCLSTGRRLRFPLWLHLRFLALGALIFSTNFLLFYYGGLTTPSGLLAVVFSLAAAINMALGAVVFGDRPSRRMLAAAVLGVVGVAAMFEPQLSGMGFGLTALHGLAFCVGGTLSFCVGTLVSRRLQAAAVPLAGSTTWGMIYGALLLALLGLVRGDTFTIDPTAVYLGSLVWLAVSASVLAFACYLTLVGRIGADRASYTSVLYPVVALAVSTAVEGYVWTAPALAGLALVIGGNLLALTNRP